MTGSALVFLALATLPALAQSSKPQAPPAHINADEAKQYVGTNAIVSGKIVEVHKSRAVVHLNFDRPYPKAPFTAIIFAANTNQFSDLDSLKDKTVEVSGKITSYQGRPEINLTKSGQLKVVEKR